MKNTLGKTGISDFEKIRENLLSLDRENFRKLVDDLISTKGENVDLVGFYDFLRERFSDNKISEIPENILNQTYEVSGEKFLILGEGPEKREFFKILDEKIGDFSIGENYKTGEKIIFSEKNGNIEVKKRGFNFISEGEKEDGVYYTSSVKSSNNGEVKLDKVFLKDGVFIDFSKHFPDDIFSIKKFGDLIFSNHYGTSKTILHKGENIEEFNGDIHEMFIENTETKELKRFFLVFNAFSKEKSYSLINENGEVIFKDAFKTDISFRTKGINDSNDKEKNIMIGNSVKYSLKGEKPKFFGYNHEIKL